MRIDLALVVLSLGAVAPPAWAGDDCEAPLGRWQTREAVRQMAAEKGWQIERLKIDDGCYEIRGTDAQGRTFKAKVDPETLKVLKMKQGDPERDRARERERERDRDRDDAARANRPPPPSSAASGTAPRRQHE